MSIMNDKEYLKSFIDKSINIKDTLEKIGLAANGKNYKTLRKYANIFEIDISHFESHADTIKRIKCSNKKYELEDILIKDFKGGVAGNTLKSKLYKAGLKNEECEICKQGPIWLGNKISLILDHINGDHQDNRIENLRILCPNCNAATSTFAGKNINKFKIRKEKIKYKFTKSNEILLSKKQLIINENIDFTKNTWGVKVGKLLNISPQYALKLVKEKIPELLKVHHT